MSSSQNQMTDATEEAGQGTKTNGLRFTPLRSYAIPARAHHKDARGESALSRLIPAARLRSCG